MYLYNTCIHIYYFIKYVSNNLIVNATLFGSATKSIWQNIFCDPYHCLYRRPFAGTTAFLRLLIYDNVMNNCHNSIPFCGLPHKAKLYKRELYKFGCRVRTTLIGCGPWAHSDGPIGDKVTRRWILAFKQVLDLRETGYGAFPFRNSTKFAPRARAIACTPALRALS